MTKKNVVGGVAAVLVAMVALPACGQAEGGGGDTGASSESPSGEDLTVGVSNLGLSFPFPSAIGEGIQRRADELGVKIVQVDAQGEAEKQANDVQDLIGQQPDGVLLLPVDSGVATGLVDQLTEADIPTRRQKSVRMER